MKLSQIVEETGLRSVCSRDDCEIEHGYVGDLLSIVMRSAKENTIWLTVQSHVNIIAVAALTGIKAIVLCEGVEFPDDTIQKAKEEGINLFTSGQNAYILAGKIYSLGVR
ncbi:MAG TPA: iron-sulfur binding hydrogenase [Fervidobacterium sp.]|nr:iron-sulfur binding hydrogenase [Fervidobacterium sp.]HOK87203.1 iron-sulfur binding hydrogenase [Fervidobacterium sp.]HOM73667.1 iron-sulfur binding hydrogenase [Fervidobacterium sp.]HOQ39062.1 iron-sulfur binding hydrogenase [Fervidobacterium sp.]HPP17336.1 iron-sulfur binding hydrogenase [Fervidobacterium sp.]